MVILSWDAFEKLPDDGIHREILEGELVVLPLAKSGYSRVATRVLRALFALEDRGLGIVYAEAGYRLTVDPAAWIQPDISFLREKRVQAADPEGYFSGAPELAVELVSPSESAQDVERKIARLLAHGSETVWVFYPRTRTVRVCLRDGSSRVLGAQGVLTLPELLPGWELAVGPLFEV